MLTSHELTTNPVFKHPWIHWDTLDDGDNMTIKEWREDRGFPPDDSIIAFADVGKHWHLRVNNIGAGYTWVLMCDRKVVEYSDPKSPYPKLDMAISFVVRKFERLLTKQESLRKLGGKVSVLIQAMEDWRGAGEPAPKITPALYERIIELGIIAHACSRYGD